MGGTAVMERAGLRLWKRLTVGRWRHLGLLTAGLPLLGVACAGTSNYENTPVIPPNQNSPLVARMLEESGTLPPLDPTSRADAGIQKVGFQETKSPSSPGNATNPPGNLPVSGPAIPGGQLPAQTAAKSDILPIDLSTVFRLAEEQNPQVAQARERLHQSQLETATGLAAFLPKITAGTAYYRHEGGIQNPDGTFVRSSFGAFYPGVDLRTELNMSDQVFQRVNAERKQWQQKGDISKVTSDVLLEAAVTYLDLLTARRAAAVAQELELKVEALQKRAEDLRKSDQSTTVIHEGVVAEVTGRKHHLIKLRQQGDAASAKLSYLLALPCEQTLEPVDPTLAPIDLVNAAEPTEKLVALALENGPGVQELQGVLSTIEMGQAQLEGPISLVPTIQMNVFEGLFNAGPGSTTMTDNRLDVGLQARWDITALFSRDRKQAISRSKIFEVRLAQQELHGKLAFGVREAQQAIKAAREQIALASQQIQRATRAYELSDQRLKANVPGATIQEVLQAIRGLETSHQSYLSSINEHNKAQVRLMVLLGPNHVQSSLPASSLPPASGQPASAIPSTTPVALPPIGSTK